MIHRLLIMKELRINHFLAPTSGHEIDGGN